MRKLITAILTFSLLLNMGVQVYAQEELEENPNVLTYEQAVEAAWKNSKSLRSLEIDVEKTYEQRKRADQMYGFSISNVESMQGVGGDVAHAMLSGTINGLVAVDRQWQIAQKQYETAKEKIAYEVHAAYQDVVIARKDLEIAENNLEQARLEKQVANLKYDYGMMSDLEKVQFDQAYLSASNTIESKKVTLEASYLTLDALIRISDLRNMELAIETKWEEIGDFDLDLHSNRVIDMSPDMWLLEQKRYLQQMEVDNYTYNQASYDTYKVKQLNVDSVKNQISSTRDAIRDGVYKLHTTVQDLEKKYQEVLINEKTLLEGVKSTKLYYELGMVPHLELLKIENQLETLQFQKFNLEAQHQRLLLLLNEPWLASSGAN